MADFAAILLWKWIKTLFRDHLQSTELILMWHRIRMVFNSLQAFILQNWKESDHSWQTFPLVHILNLLMGLQQYIKTKFIY